MLYMDSSSVPSSGPNWGLIAGGVFVVIVIVVVSLYFSGVFGSSPSSTPSMGSSPTPMSQNAQNIQAMINSIMNNSCPAYASAQASNVDSLGAKAVPIGQTCPGGMATPPFGGGITPAAGFQLCTTGGTPLPSPPPTNITQLYMNCIKK
jgi:hypothetical protein